MAKMGIENVEKNADYRVIEAKRTGTYKAKSAITVPDGKLIIVAIENSETTYAQIKEYDGTAGDIIAGVIKENAVAGETSLVIKRGKIDVAAIDTSNITGLEAYEVFELLEHQGLFPENLSERRNY